MNSNLTGLIAFMVGAVLIYAAVKDKDPRDVFKESVGQKTASHPKSDSKPGTQPNSYNPHEPYYSPGVPV